MVLFLTCDILGFNGAYNRELFLDEKRINFYFLKELVLKYQFIIYTIYYEACVSANEINIHF